MESLLGCFPPGKPFLRFDRERARGRWRHVLGSLGVSADYLDGKHHGCPICRAGKDRFRFDDRDGDGTWICSHCGAGDGIMLVQAIRGVDFRGAAELVCSVIGGDAPPEPSPRRQSRN
jgi:putative DNA primase/helicase